MQRVAEFSANAYLDVYRGHVNSLSRYKDNRIGTFNSMMSDIYAKARCVNNSRCGSGVNWLASITVWLEMAT